MTHADNCECAKCFAAVTSESLKDHFAMAALTGFLSADYGGSTDELCEAAYEVANAMMAERTRQAKG